MKKLFYGMLLAAAVLLAAGAAAFFLLHGKTPASGTQAENGALIESVSPSGTVAVCENQILQINVRAEADCQVFVKLGSARFDAAAAGVPTDGKNVFCAFLTMPGSAAEVASLGYLSVTAMRGAESQTLQAVQLVYTSPETAPVSQIYDSDLLDVGNQVVTTQPPAESLPVSAVSVPAGAQLCMVCVDEADTWSAQATDDLFIPTNTTLAYGTMDYVVGRTQVFDAEENELRDFYILASGRKVKTDAVQLVTSTQMNDNRLSVLSSTSTNGALELRIQSDWSVPYDFSFAPQSYYAARGKAYHVSDFTAARIQFTFYYTAAAGGAIDAAGSDVVSSGDWSVDTARKTATLTLTLRAPGRYYGYTLRRDQDGSFRLTIQNKPKSLSGLVVVLDPGHGGKDSGALGYGGAVKESQLNFALAVATKTALEQRGATVILTRTDDVYSTLEDRKQFARQQNPDLFLSIHCNAAENKTRYGTSVYYFRPMSQPLASAIYQQLHALFRGFYAADAARQSRAGEGAFFHPFSVTRLENCPSVLIETGYVTNDQECALLLDAGNRDKIAAAICSGLEAYCAR